MFLLTFFVYPSLIPSYLVVTGLGLRDNLLALILPTAVNAFNLIVMRAFFMNLPQDLMDSARMYCAGELRILTRIVMPLSKAVIAVVALFYAVGYLNAFFNAMLYIQNRDLDPIQRVLQQYILAGQAPPVRGDVANLPGVVSVPPSLAIQMAVIVITIVPCVLVYPFVQRHFVKGRHHRRRQGLITTCPDQAPGVNDDRWRRTPGSERPDQDQRIAQTTRMQSAGSGQCHVAEVDHAGWG